jgi:SAM-dependent methyltransferase
MIEKSSHYLGERGKKYFEERFNEQQTFGISHQSRYFAPFCSPNAVLLDLGCGDGTMLRLLPAAKKYGVEINPHCHKKIHELNRDLSCPINLFDSIYPISDNSVDIVISNHCIEHIPNPFEALNQVKRVLVPGGKFVLVTPFDDWRQKDYNSWKPGHHHNHLYTWPPMNIGNLLTEAGFDVHEVRLSTSAWSPKIFWVHRLFGELPFRIACNLLSRLIQRREVLSIANKPSSGEVARHHP